MRFAFLALLFVLLARLAAAEEMVMRIIQVQHQPPEALVDRVRPFLSPQGVIVPNSNNGTLIVRDYPARLDQIEQVVHQLDVVAPQVHVKVHLDTMDRGAVRTLIGTTDVKGMASSDMFLTVVSGGSGTLQIVDRSPDAVWFANYAAQQGYVPAGIVFTDVGTGLQVAPRVVGQDVILTVTPCISYHDGLVAFREASTEVRVRSGDTATIAVGTQTSSQLIRYILGASQSNTSTLSITVTPEIVQP